MFAVHHTEDLPTEKPQRNMRTAGVVGSQMVRDTLCALLLIVDLRKYFLYTSPEICINGLVHNLREIYERCCPTGVNKRKVSQYEQ